MSQRNTKPWYVFGVGLAIFALGVVATLVSFFSAGFGEKFHLFWGPIVFGILQTLLGVFLIIKSHSDHVATEESADAGLEPAAPGPIRLPGVFILFVVCAVLYVASVIFVGIFVIPMGVAELTRGAFGLTTIIFLAVIPYVVARLILRPNLTLLSGQFGLSGTRWHLWLPVLAALVCWTLASQQIGFFISRFFEISSRQQTFMLEFMTAEGMLGWISALLWIAVVPAICEEFFFRGLLLRGLLQRVPFWPSALITSALFTLMHLDLAHALPIFILGLVLAVIAHGTGSIWYAVIMHAVINTTALIFSNLTPRHVVDADLFSVPLAVVAVVAGLLTVARLSQRFTKAPPPPEPEPGRPAPVPFDMPDPPNTTATMLSALGFAGAVAAAVGFGFILDSRGIVGTDTASRANFIAWAARADDFDDRDDLADLVRLDKRRLGEFETLLSDERSQVRRGSLIAARKRLSVTSYSDSPHSSTNLTPASELIARCVDDAAPAVRDLAFATLAATSGRTDEATLRRLFSAPKLRRWLTEHLTSTDSDRRTTATRILMAVAGFHGQRGEYLATLLTEEPAEHRLVLLKTFCQLAYRGPKPPPSAVTQNPDAFLPAVSAILACLHDESDEVRDTALRLLGNIRQHQAREFFGTPAYADALINSKVLPVIAGLQRQTAAGSKAGYGIEALSGSLWYSIDASAVLVVHLLAQDDPQVRLDTLAKISKGDLHNQPDGLGQALAGPIVRCAVGDEDPAVRRAAIKVIAHIFYEHHNVALLGALYDSADELLPPLLDALAGGGKTAQNAQRILGHMVALHGRGGDVLARALADPRGKIRVGVLRARLDCRYPRQRLPLDDRVLEASAAGIKLLLEALGDNSSKVREVALELLGGLNADHGVHMFAHPEVAEALLAIDGIGATLNLLPDESSRGHTRGEELFREFFATAAGVRAMLAGLLADDDPAVRRRVLTELDGRRLLLLATDRGRDPDRYDATMQNLYRTLHDPDPAVQVAACRMFNTMHRGKRLVPEEIGRAGLARGMITADASAALEDTVEYGELVHCHLAADLLCFLARHSDEVRASVDGLIADETFSGPRRQILEHALGGQE